MPNQATTEAVIYQYNGKDILISDKRIVLGKETWTTDSVAGASLVTDSVRLSPLEINSDLSLLERRAPGIILVIVGVLLFWVLPFSFWTVAISLVLAVAGSIISFAVVTRQSREAYRIRLHLKRAPGTYSDYEARYVWKYKPAAQRLSRQ